MIPKLPMPTTGKPQTGLMQFGDELPGIYITAEDAFALRMSIDDVERVIPFGIDLFFEEDDLNRARSDLEDYAGELYQKLSEFRRILNLSPFGSAAHLKKQREASKKPLATAA